MWTFFQIERTFNACWIFGVWSALSDSALRDYKAEIIIYNNDGREYSAKMKILSIQSNCKSAAFKKGYHLMVLDTQLFNTSAFPHEKKLLAYKVTIFTL